MAPAAPKPPTSTSRPDFFISYTSADEAWATWIAQELEAAGYRVFVSAWDFRPGMDFLTLMEQGIKRAKRLLVILSPDYLNSAYGTAEWRAVYTDDVLGEHGRLVPIRIDECEPPSLLSSRVFIELAGLNDEQAAREALLAGVAPGRVRPHAPVLFPGRQRDTPQALLASERNRRFPGRGPGVCNLPARSPVFTGRAEQLTALNAHLAPGRPVAVVAVQGLGGIGKTQLVLEYAYRHLTDLGIVWWIRAESPLTITADLAALALRLGLPVDADQEAMVAAVVATLRTRPDWLLIFDNASRPEDLAAALPGGAGRAVITSRWQTWGDLAHPLSLDVPPRTEAIAFLLARTGQIDKVAADRLAELVGDLPLALAQLAAYLSRNQLSLAQGVELYQQAEQRLLEAGPPVGYPQPVATTWQLHIDRFTREAPATVALLRLCSFLNPDAIPIELLLNADPALLPDELAAVARDPLTRVETVGMLAQTSLLTRLDDGNVRLHRLVGAVTRHRLGSEQAAIWAGRTVRLIEAIFPDQPQEPAAWPVANLLSPHGQTATAHAEPLQTELTCAARLLTRIGHYLTDRAELDAALRLYERAQLITEQVYGSNHAEVASILGHRGIVLRRLGDAETARELHERALTITEHVYGPNHPKVAHALDNLGIVLGELRNAEAARELHERALTITEHVYGPDHPEVATTLTNLGIALGELGEIEAAQARLERALGIVRAAWGDGHPLTRQIIQLSQVVSSQPADARTQRLTSLMDPRLTPRDGEQGPALSEAERTTFEAFFLENVDKVRASLLLASAGDDEMADDATTEAFTRAVTRWADVVAHPNPQAWIQKVALNIVRDNQRRISRIQSLQTTLLSSYSPLMTDVVSDYDITSDYDMRDAMQRALDDRERMVVTMQVLEGLVFRGFDRVGAGVGAG